MACDAKLLDDVVLFEHVEGEDRARLAEFIDEQRLAAGDTLFKTGEPGESLYIVRSMANGIGLPDSFSSRVLRSKESMCETPPDM